MSSRSPACAYFGSMVHRSSSSCTVTRCVASDAPRLDRCAATSGLSAAAQIEARLRDKGPEGKPLEDHEVAQVRNDWEEHMKKEKKRLLKANKGQEEDTPKKEGGEEQEEEENPEDVRAIKPHALRHCTL